MVTYNAMNSATSNTVANTEDVWIEIAAPAQQLISIKRLKVFYDGGATAVGDNTVGIRVVSLSSAAIATVTSATVITATASQFSASVTPVSPMSRSTSCTVYVKNGTVGFNYSTTGVGAVFLSPRFNERGFYEYVPRDYTEYVDSPIGGILAIMLKSSAASRVYNVEMEWEE